MSHRVTLAPSLTGYMGFRVHGLDEAAAVGSWVYGSIEEVCSGLKNKEGHWSTERLATVGSCNPPRLQEWGRTRVQQALPLYVRGGLTESGQQQPSRGRSQLADSDSLPPLSLWSCICASHMQTWPEPEGEGDSVCPGYPLQVGSRAEIVEVSPQYYRELPTQSPQVNTRLGGTLTTLENASFKKPCCCSVDYHFSRYSSLDSF